MEKGEHKKETSKRWRRNRRHPCITCGKLCDYRAKRCRHCGRIQGWKIRVRPNRANTKKSGGYTYIYKPEYPRANKQGYVAEHILIWEQANGKTLPEHWVIHHLNGIKTDNRVRNLEALPSRKHCLVLQAKAKRIQELEGILSNQHQLI